MSRQHALVTHIRMPAVDRDAGSQLVDHTIRFLLDGGWRVTFLAKEEPGAAERRHANRLRRMGVPAYAGFGWAERLLRSSQFDLALISYWEPAATLVPLVRRLSPRTRVAVNTIDLHFLRDARRSLARRAALDGAFGATATKELNAYNDADAVLAVSDKERDLLADFFGDRVFTLPLVQAVERSPHPLEDRRGMVFVGNFRHLPNCEAVEFLCRDILPLLEPGLVDSHPLTVLGNRLEHAGLTVDPAAPGVNLVGWVPSVQPYIHRARLAVVPLLHGAGVKGKVVEPMMGGTPVVTTPIGAEGLDLVQGEHALIGSDPTDLAAGITRLLTDDDLWRRVASLGADHVDARLRPEVVAPRFHEIVERVMARPARRDAPPVGAAGNDRAASERALADRVRTIAVPGDVVLVPVGSNGAVPDLTPQRAWPFPEPRNGEPAHEPVDGDAAVNHLESQRQRGARWFALPSWVANWRHRYPELLDHLENRYLRLHHDEHLALYRLDGRRARSAGATARATVHVLGTYAAGRAGPSPTLLAALRDHGGLTVSQSWRSAADPAWSVSEDAPDADYVVAIDDRAIPPARFLPELIATQETLQVDRLQPAHHSGPTAAPPITERQLGTVAREVDAVTPLPVLSVRRGAGPTGPAALSDEVTVGLRAPLPTADPAVASDVRQFWVRDPGDEAPREFTRPEPKAPPRISVLIATHDRPELLRSCVASFAHQTLAPAEFEVVVVDDGSRDPVVPGLVDELADRMQVVAVRIPHSGRSAAKNLAVMLARAPVVLFFDDDDRATPSYLARHLASHDARPDEAVAVLGHTDWAPELTRTPLMHYVTDVDRMLFAYERLQDGQVLDWHGFWEGRVSCKRSLLLRCGLHDQRLGYSIDVELAWRLRSSGLRVVYNASALSLMARPIDVDAFGARSEAKGRAHATVAALHPGTEIASRLLPAGAAELWDQKRQAVGQLRHRTTALEASASSGDDDVLPELHAAYRELFRVLHAKGVAAATTADPAVDVAAPPTAPARRLVSGPEPALVHDGLPAGAGRTSQLSVTIPVWSRTPDLADMARRTIERVWEVARVPTEVVVIDNGSPVEVPLPARVYRYPENLGVSVGWNAGIRLASAPVMAVLNSDCRVEPGWDEALLDAALDGRRIAFPYTDHCDGRGFARPDQAGTAGWCFALTKDLYEEIGPFDEWFSPAFCEDTDYWHRAWELGVELSPVPAARVVHARRTSSQAGADLLLRAHRVKYGWKHGVDPDRAPPYYNREVVDYRPKPKWMRVRSGPDRPRVFCIGLNKTGTSSFHAAMEILGLSSLHWGGPEINGAVRAALDGGRPLLSGIDPGFDAFSDIGLLSTHFDLLDEQYPGSRFVLTVRPLDEWIDSRRRHVERNIARRDAGDYRGNFLVVDEALWREQWARQVGGARRYFEGRRDFLDADLTAGRGWGPLCDLLEVPEPTETFPWANRDRARDPDG
jgi:GT2 family glycosyltransferase/glycosyltransferase involved in cell wall biosynthesis